MTVTVDPGDIDEAFQGALDADAGRRDDTPPPPKTPWLNEDGTPKYGFKADGVTPKKGPGGPGRPKTDDAGKAREGPPGASTPAGDPPKPQPAEGERDYSGDIEGIAFLAWMATASTPWTKAQAAIIKNATPMLVPSWNSAAQHNSTIRSWVEKFSGAGGLAWIPPVVASTTALSVGLWESMRNPQVRAGLAGQTAQDWQDFIAETARANGMTPPGENGSGPQPQPGSPSTAPA